MSALSRMAAHALVVLSCGIGGGGLALFGWFLLAASPLGVDLGLGAVGALGLNTALSGAFFLQHSGMVRGRWQRFLATLVPGECVAAIYSVASGAVLLAVVFLWQEVGNPVLVVSLWARWVIRMAQVAGGAVMVWSWWALGSLDALGVRPILDRLRGRPRGHQPCPPAFASAGPYRWVRHPMYLAALLLIWGHPAPTADRVLFDLLWTLWVVAGARLEEVDLVAAFGEPYRAYQARVPMLIPHRSPSPSANHRGAKEGVET